MLKSFRNKTSALALAGVVGITGLGIASYSSPVSYAADASQGEACGEIKAAIAVDNSTSISTDKEKKEKVIKAYSDFIDKAKKLDPNAEITILPIYSADRSYRIDKDPMKARFYSKTFKLGDSKDYKLVKDVIKEWDFEGKGVGKDVWTRKDILDVNKYPPRAESELFHAVKRAEVLNKDRNFNLFITVSDEMVTPQSEDKKENLVSVGKKIREQGVTIKSIIIDGGIPRGYVPSEDDIQMPSKDKIMKMTNDKPQEGKDYFESDYDKMGASLDSLVGGFCKSNPPKPKPKPKPTSEKPTSKPTSEEPTSEEPTSTTEEPTTPSISDPDPVTSTVENDATVTETTSVDVTKDSTAVENTTVSETETSNETTTKKKTETVSPAPVTSTASQTQVVENPVPVVQPATPQPVYGPKVHTGGKVEQDFSKYENPTLMKIVITLGSLF